MSKFTGLAKNGFKAGIVYRAHFFVGLIRVPLALIIYYYLWQSIFAHNGEDIIRGFTFSDMVAYYAISMLVGMFTWCDIDAWMSDDIKSGVVVSDFLRPLSYMANLFSVYLGMVLLGVLIQVIPVILLAVFLMKIQIPSLIFLVLFLVSVVLAALLSFLIAFNVGLAAFWFNEIYGLRKVKTALTAFLEGALIPLTFFPLWFQNVSAYLPFQYMRFVPVNMFLQKYTVVQCLEFLSIQLLWILGLYIFSKLVFTKAFKKFSGAGV